MSLSATFGDASPRLRAGLLVMLALSAAAILGPLASQDPNRITDPPEAGLLPPGSMRSVVRLRTGATLAGQQLRFEHDSLVLLRLGVTETVTVSNVERVDSVRFWLGTDALGRDVLARLLWGGRVTLAIGLTSLLLALGVGTCLGLAAGWRGGLLDGVLMRLVDALLAVPVLFLLIIIAALFRPSLTALVLLLALTAWTGVARLVRGQVLTLKEREFVLAARAIGASPSRIAATHLVPNLLTPLAQDAALRLADLVLAEAALSFLGLGVQPPLASWGGMVAQAEAQVFHAWWLAVLPGAAITLTVVGAAVTADGLAEMGRS
ncbi:MAG: ABC transporter permease [Acidobacteriota bacterium]